MSKKRQNSEPRSLNPRFWQRSIIWLAILALLFLVPLCCGDFKNTIGQSWFQVLALTLFVCLVVSVCSKLTDIFSLRRKENGITWCQIAILVAAMLWIIGFILVFNIQKDSRYFLAIGIVGTMLGWVFQDTLKGVVAFLHIRLNHLLSIDDWIQVPKYNVDGEVKRITLTTVTIYNRDTTTSSIPTSILHSDHFVDLQKMSDGKTYGRLMEKSFIIDTSKIHPISKDEAEQLKLKEEMRHLVPEEEIKEGVLNAHLFRHYVYHWMMNNPRVSQLPRLVVRWMEQKETGLPLQVYAFILDTSFTAFEWQQSQIIEHIIESLDWFGLRLYQSPSSRDINSYMDRLANLETANKKEVLS